MNKPFAAAARGLARRAHFRYQQQLRNLSMLLGHKDYTRFIILGRSRSGSNFLRGLLNSHPRVVAFGELFQTEASIQWGLSDYAQTPERLHLFHTQPVQFLETEIFHRFPKRVQAVGFKLFYYHARTPQWMPVWDYLAAQRNLKVIHIRRENLLKVHLSRKRAQLTDQWVNTSGETPTLAPIALDYAECLDDFEQTRAWESEADQFFADHARLDLSYEALARDYRADMARVERFLGIDRATPSPETYPQSQHPLSAAITNYQTLKSQFQGSVWESFFED